DRVGLRFFQDALRIPNEELKGAGWFAPSGGVPIGGAIPIGVAAVQICNHVVDKLWHIEQPADDLILLWIANASVGQGHQALPGGSRSLQNVVAIANVVIFGSTAQMRRHKGRTGSFAQIVKTPIESIEIEMHEQTPRRRMPHCAQGITHPLVSQIIASLPLL